MIALWLDESLYFTTGETERKARNLEQTRMLSSQPAAMASTRG